MVTYLDLLNRARARQASAPISAIGIGENTGDALQGIQAVNNAVATFYDNSFDLDATEKVASIVTTIGNSELSPPADTWDTNVIKGIKYQKSGNDFYTDLVLITLEESEDLKLKTFSSNDPQYWWVNNSKVYILPIPTAAYTIKVFYQQMYPDITNSNITSTIVLPNTGLKTLSDGVYSYLREQLGDPQWLAYRQAFESQVVKFYQRNKHTYKRKGFRLFRVRPNLGDRNL